MGFELSLFACFFSVDGLSFGLEVTHERALLSSIDLLFSVCAFNHNPIGISGSTELGLPLY